MSETPPPESPTKTGLPKQQPRPTEADKQTSPTGTLGFDEPGNPEGPTKSGVAVTNPPSPKK
jgi:hypothetical protein